MYGPSCAVLLTVIVAGITGASPAQATVRVGYAMLIERNVSGTQSGELRKVTKGDDIFENEFIRTETASIARLLFVDKTQLVLGPTTIAKLDRLVFNPDQSVKALTVSARAGAIRWISGDSVSSAYEVETSTVVIRPHGTMFDILVEPQRTMVVLQEGMIEVCLIDAPQRCRVLFRRGERITATRNAIEATQMGGPGSSDFEDRCLSVASKECVIGISINPPEPSPKTDFGKRRAEPRAPSKTHRQVPRPEPSLKTGNRAEPRVPSKTPNKIYVVVDQHKKKPVKKSDDPPQQPKVTQDNPPIVARGDDPPRTRIGGSIAVGGLIHRLFTGGGNNRGGYNRGGYNRGGYNRGGGGRVFSPGFFRLRPSAGR